jgi:hypothetical protein
MTRWRRLALSLSSFSSLGTEMCWPIQGPLLPLYHLRAAVTAGVQCLGSEWSPCHQAASAPPPSLQTEAIQAVFCFERRKVTRLAQFKNSFCLVLWAIFYSSSPGASESQIAPFISLDPIELPCLGQDESQLVILQKVWETACPVIRVALGGNSAGWKGGLWVWGWEPLPKYGPDLLPPKW